MDHSWEEYREKGSEIEVCSLLSVSIPEGSLVTEIENIWLALEKESLALKMNRVNGSWPSYFPTENDFPMSIDLIITDLQELVINLEYEQVIIDNTMISGSGWQSDWSSLNIWPCLIDEDNEQENYET